MGLFKRIVNKVKSWLTGGSNKATPPKASSGGSYRNQSSGRVSYYGGSSGSSGNRGYSRNDDEEERRRKKQEEKKRQERQEAFKAKKATYKDSGASVSLKKPVPDPKETARRESQERARATLKSIDNKVANYANSTSEVEKEYRTASDKRIAARRKALDLATKKAYENDPKRNAARESMENRQAARERLIEEKAAKKAKRQEKHEAYHTATHHRYDVAEKGISAEERKKRVHNIQSATLGEMMGGRDDEAVDVMKAKMKYDKVGESARRGLANAFTASTLDLAEKRLNRGERKEAEEYYQKNKSKLAEGAGSLAGSLLLYGGTANTFEELGSKAVGKAATTKAGKKLGAEALAKTMAGKGAKAALTRSLVGDAIQDSTIGLVDTAASVAARDDLKTPSDYAKAIAKGQAANYVMGLAGNAAAHGVPVARRAWSNFADESRKLRIVPDGMDDLVAERKQILDDIFSKNERSDPAAINRLKEIDAEIDRIKKASPEEITDESVKKSGKATAPKEKITNENVKKEAPRKPTKNEKLRSEYQAEFDELAERYRVAKEDGSMSKAELQQTLDDMQELEAMIGDLDAKIKTADARRAAKQAKATPPEAEPANPRASADEPANPRASVEEPETRLAPTEESTETGRNAGAGERTEFRRSEEETAREQARNRRTANNREPASQESFDRDFSAFEQRINESRERAAELRGRIRAAASAEEREALKQQLDALNEEIGREYRRASMRYHPDRGGSDEWMGRFNEAYNEYKHGSYSSPGFSGAGSYTRPRPEAGGGNGNTPPPRRGSTANGEKGFNRPKGRATKGEARKVYRGEDTVFKRKEKTTLKERGKSVMDDARMRLADSHAPFEDEARKFAKSDPKKMQNMYGAIDAHRKSNAIAVQSTHNKQLNYMGDAYENGKSLKDIYKGMDADTEKAFDYYLLLKHAPDRAREGKPIWKNTELALDGRSLENDPAVWDSEIKRLLKDHPEFEAKAEDVYQYTRNELQNLVDAGIVSRKTADEWLSNHPFYVPTHRMGESTSGIAGSVQGSDVGAKGIKSASGSDKDIRSIRDQLEESTRQNWEDITLNDMLKSTFGDKIRKEPIGDIEGDFDMALENNISIAKSRAGKKYYAIIRDGGERYRVEIDKKYVDGLEDWNKHGKTGIDMIDVPNEALSKAAHVFKDLITEKSPIFMLKNPMRDFPEAFANSRQPKEFSKNIVAAAKDLATGGPYSTALRNAGISQSSFFDLDREILEEVSKSNNPMKLLTEKIAAGNQFMEMWPRTAEYMATFEKAGVPLEKADKALRNRAAANAADVTVNFGRSGNISKTINKGLVPFFNPSVQGWSKFVRNFSEQPSTRSLLLLLTRFTAMGAGATAINNYFLADNPNYQQISARDKANNYLIPVTFGKERTLNNTETFIKIPKSRFASVYSLPIVNAFNDNKMGWAEMIKVANDQIAPVSPAENNLFAPFISTMGSPQGETWYGTPIVPESMSDLLPSQQYDANTSWFGKTLGKATENLPRGLQISPKKADYLIDAETGVIGDFALPMATPSRQGDSNNLLKKYGTPFLNVPKRAFSIDSATQNDISSRYYDRGELLEQTKNAPNASSEDQAAYKRYESWNERVKNVTGAMRYIQESDLPNKQEAYRELAKLRNDNMQKALDGRTSINNTRDISIIHKYAGTSYTIENLGKSADQNALKAYGASVYGNLSEDEMRKKIDSDTEFYKGYEGIVKTQNALQKVNPSLKGGNGLAYAVGLANAGASDEVFAAYNTTVQSRTESASKAQRAKDYFKNSGSIEEFAQLENAVKSLGKLSDVDKDKLEDDAYARLKRGEITTDEYNTELKKISYNANQSYVGKAVSLAQSGAPARAYNLYDIKKKNVQKGYNLAAMGIDSRAYREMSQACDKDGNGYLKTAEIKEYVANSDIEDKATLFDALCYYSNVRNPFGTPNRYSPEEAAEVGRRNGVAQIKANAGADNTAFIESSSSSSGYGGYGGYGGYYRRRGYRRYGRGGGSSKSTAPAIKQSDFKAKKATYKDAAKDLPKASSSSRSKSANYNTSAIKSNTASAIRNTPKRSSNSTVKITPPTVKFKKYEV